MWLCSSSMSIIEDPDPSVHLDILTARHRALTRVYYQLGKMAEAEREKAIATELNAKEGLRVPLDNEREPVPIMVRCEPHITCA